MRFQPLGLSVSDSMRGIHLLEMTGMCFDGQSPFLKKTFELVKDKEQLYSEGFSKHEAPSFICILRRASIFASLKERTTFLEFSRATGKPFHCFKAEFTYNGTMMIYKNFLKEELIYYRKN